MCIVVVIAAGNVINVLTLHVVLTLANCTRSKLRMDQSLGRITQTVPISLMYCFSFYTNSFGIIVEHLVWQKQL